MNLGFGTFLRKPVGWFIAWLKPTGFPLNPQNVVHFLQAGQQQARSNMGQRVTHGGSGAEVRSGANHDQELRQPAGAGHRLGPMPKVDPMAFFVSLFLVSFIEGVSFIYIYIYIFWGGVCFFLGERVVFKPCWFFWFLNVAGWCLFKTVLFSAEVRVA